MIPRGKYIGERVGIFPADEAEHFYKCPACSGWVDMRDLGLSLRTKRRYHTQPKIRRNDA